MTAPTEHTFDVDLSGLLRVFGGHLYSTPAVFVRELVQNAADALLERRRSEPDFKGTITVRADPERRCVEVLDDGTGLDAAGLALYLGRIGASSKRTADGAPREDLLGQFGIGLLSGFLVAEALEVETRKAGAEGLRWRARVDGHYAIEPAPEAREGTLVRVPLSQRFYSYSEPAVLSALVRHYARYLPFDVRFEEAGVATRCSEEAPWLSDEPRAARRWLTAQGVPHLFALPLRVGTARGLVWVHPGRAQLGGGRAALYLRGMLLSEANRELLPDWAGFASAIFEAPGLAPTASREDVVRDGAWRALQDGVRDALLQWLGHLPERDPSGFESFLQAHHLFVKGACLESGALLGALGDRMPFESNQGMCDLATWRSTVGPREPLRYVTTMQDFSRAAPLAGSLGVLNASYVYDVPFLTQYAAAHGLRTEELTVERLGMLIEPAADDEPRYAEVLAAAQTLLEPFAVRVSLGRFTPPELPAFLLTDAAQLRERARGVLERSEPSSVHRALLGALPGVKQAPATRFVLNVDNPLVASLPSADVQQAARAVRLLCAQASMLLRRTLSMQETRLFSQDLLALLGGLSSAPTPHASPAAAARKRGRGEGEGNGGGGALN